MSLDLEELDLAVKNAQAMCAELCATWPHLSAQSDMLSWFGVSAVVHAGEAHVANSTLARFQPEGESTHSRLTGRAITQQARAPLARLGDALEQAAHRLAQAPAYTTTGMNLLVDLRVSPLLSTVELGLATIGRHRIDSPRPLPWSQVSGREQTLCGRDIWAMALRVQVGHGPDWTICAPHLQPAPMCLPAPTAIDALGWAAINYDSSLLTHPDVRINGQSVPERAIEMLLDRPHPTLKDRP